MVGMFLVRWHSLAWRTPWSTPPLTSAEFFRTADAVHAAIQQGVAHTAQPVVHSTRCSSVGSDGHGSGLEGGKGGDVESSSEGGAASLAGGAEQQQQQQAGHKGEDAGVPFMRPLLISKINTVLQLSLVGG